MKKASVIVETSMGKYLLREFRPPLPLRSSPRKKKLKLKKGIKRLSSEKQRVQGVEGQEKKSLVIVISAEKEEDLSLTEEDLTQGKCR